jgi:hypothetical protein
VLQRARDLTVGFSTVMGFIIMGAGALVLVVGDLQDVTEPLGLSPDVWLKVSVGAAILVIAGRMLQAMADAVGAGLNGIDPGKGVLVGVATMLGAFTTGLTGLPILLSQLADTAAPLGIPESTWMTAAAVLAAATLIGRYLQSAVNFLASFLADRSQVRDLVVSQEISGTVETVQPVLPENEV